MFERPELLNALGIDLVVNCTSHSATVNCPAGMEMMFFEFNHNFNISKDNANAFFRQVQTLLRGVVGRTVALGCEHGAHRSAGTCCLLLVAGGPR